MNINSFQIKGWAITIVSATLAISVSTKNQCFVLIGLFPTILFWFLDANYLTQEKRFRSLHNDVAGVSEEPVVPNPKSFTMNIEPYEETEPFRKAFWSDTIAILYLAVLILLIVIFTYLNHN